MGGSQGVSVSDGCGEEVSAAAAESHRLLLLHLRFRAAHRLILLQLPKFLLRLLLLLLLEWLQLLLLLASQPKSNAE